MSVVGFDLGYQSSLIACPKQGGIEVIANEYSQRKTSSLVSFKNKQRVLGEAAKSVAITNFRNTIKGMKRFIGRQYSDPDVQAELARASFKHAALPDGSVGFQVDWLDQAELLSAAQVVAMLLVKLKATASNELNSKVHDVCVGVPVWFNDYQRQVLLNATKIAGLNCLRLCNETSAAALAYGIYKQDLPAKEETPRRVVFVDVGHSQMQLCAADFIKGKLTILGSAALPNLGGRDFDLALFDMFCEEFNAKYKIDIRSNARASIRLEAECEKIKKTMSANSNAIPLNIECLMNDKDVSGKVDREQFEGLVAPIVKKIEETCQGFVKMLADLGTPLTPELVYAVEVVGGSSRIPCIKAVLQSVFQKELSTTLNLDEAVARGCALQAAIVSPTFRVRDFDIVEKTPYAISVNYTGRDGKPQSDVLFKPQSGAGMIKVISFTRDAEFDLQATYTEPAVIPGNMDMLGSFAIKGVKPSFDGEAQKVKVKLVLDSHGRFQVDSATMSNKLKPEPEVEAEGADGSMEGVEAVKDGDAPPDVAMDSGSPAAGEGEGEAEGAKADDKAEAAKKEEPVKAKKKKAKSHETVRLQVETTKPGLLTPEELNLLIEKENDMQSQDRIETETSHARNALEEFIYDIRDKIKYKYKDFIKEADSAAFVQVLEDTETWLYEDGEDEKKAVYVERLTNLKATSDPVIQRSIEFEARPKAEEQVRQRIVHYRKFLDQWKAGDDAVSHIAKEDVDMIAAAVEQTEQFLNDKAAAQAQLAKFDTPVFLTTDCQTKLSELDIKCQKVSETPKPTPPKEDNPPDKEMAAEDGAAKPAEGEAPAPADTETPATDAEKAAEDASMDLD